MSQFLIIVGGGIVVVAWLALVGYALAHLAARRYPEGILSAVCALFISVLTIIGVINAPHWAQVLWK